MHRDIAPGRPLCSPALEIAVREVKQQRLIQVAAGFSGRGSSQWPENCKTYSDFAGFFDLANRRSLHDEAALDSVGLPDINPLLTRVAAKEKHDRGRHRPRPRQAGVVPAPG